MSDNLVRIIIYNTEQGGKIEVKLEENTVWLNQNQISELFNVGKSTINYHINNILKEEELSKNSVVRIFRITA